MYKWLGYISVVLVVLLTAPYWLRIINGWTFKTKDKRFFNLIKFLRKLHKPMGIALAVIPLWHGYLALGSIRLHTGLLAYSAFFLTVSLGIWFYLKKGKSIFKIHKSLALLAVLLLIVHLLWPSALWYLFKV